jgi:anti-sigma B factor antagonist
VKVMTVKTRKAGAAHWIGLGGELDISTVPEVEREMARVERQQPPRVVMDLRDLTFIDSTGLRVVLAADARCRRWGGELVLIAGPPAVHRVFRIALLDRRLQFVSDPEGLEALEAVEAPDAPGGLEGEHPDG